MIRESMYLRWRQPGIWILVSVVVRDEVGERFTRRRETARGDRESGQRLSRC
jgi:hypothetical protein